MPEVDVAMRAYRPSLLSEHEPDRIESEVIRLANLERYIRRARAGLPLFEESTRRAGRTGRSLSIHSRG
jgi:hypothetical protein